MPVAVDIDDSLVRIGYGLDERVMRIDAWGL